MTLEEILEHTLQCPSGCQLWLGGDTGTGRGGYGKVRYEGRMQSVHRVVYTELVGPIPPGWEVDHLCARWGGYSWPRRRCCNIEHLECVPGDVNNRRRMIAMDRAMNRGDQDDQYH